MHKNVNCILPLLTVRGSHTLWYCKLSTHTHTSSRAQRNTHAHILTHTRTNTNNMKVTVQTNFGLLVCFSLIFLAEFSIIAQRLLHRLCQIIASFLHFSRENESIPWELSSRAGLCNPERQTLAKTLASDAGNGLACFTPDLNAYAALTRSLDSPTSGWDVLIQFRYLDCPWLLNL